MCCRARPARAIGSSIGEKREDVQFVEWLTELDNGEHGCAGVNPSMAFGTEGDQIVLGIVPRLAAKLFVVNLKIGHRATRLASPAVPAEHLIAKLVVEFGIQAQTCVLWSEPVHEAFSVA